MEYIYAALLLHRLGKEINEENLSKVIESAGATADQAKVKTLLASLKGVDIARELETATLIGTAPAANAGAPETKAEKKEPKAEESAEGLSSLFG